MVPGGEGSGSGLRLLDAEPVARRVADGRIPDTPGLGGGLLQDLDPRCVGDLLEGGIEVRTAEVDRVQLAFGQQGSQRVSVLLGPSTMWLGKHDPDFGLGAGHECDPAVTLVGDVETHGQAKRVAVEGEGGFRIVEGMRPGTVLGLSKAWPED